jgi:hypothetical protein
MSSTRKPLGQPSPSWTDHEFSRSSRRRLALLGVCLAVGSALVIALALILIPPAQGVPCGPAPGTSEAIGGRTYCAASVPALRGGDPFTNVTANYTEWGVVFQLGLIQSSSWELVISVTVLFGTPTWGIIALGAGGFEVCNVLSSVQTVCTSPVNSSSPAWFTADYYAGVMFSTVPEFPPSNLTLLVEYEGFGSP